MKKQRCASDDFTEKDLPQNRKQVFFDCFKVQYSVILRLGLLCLLFILPILLSVTIKDIYIISSVSALEEKSAENIAKIYLSANVFYGICEVASFTIFFFLFSGIVKVVRQLIWGEPIFFGDDYKNGLKSNKVKYFVVSFIVALVLYLLGFIQISVLRYILTGIVIAIILPIAIWVLLQTIFYNLSLWASIKNAFKYYFKGLPVTLLLLAVTVLPFWLVLTLVPMTLYIVKIIFILIFAVFFIIPLTMAWMLYACRLFDKYVNEEHYPQIYKKGMYKGDTDIETKP